MSADYFVPKRNARQEGCPFHPDYAIKLAKQGLFPAPLVLGPRRVGWMKSALQGWLESKREAQKTRRVFCTAIPETNRSPARTSTPVIKSRETNVRTRDNQSPEPLAVSTDEAVRRSGIGKTNLYKLMADGSLPFVKIGERRLILIADLTALLLANRLTLKGKGAQKDALQDD